MKILLAVAVIALSGSLTIAKLENGECEGTLQCIDRVNVTMISISIYYSLYQVLNKVLRTA